MNNIFIFGAIQSLFFFLLLLFKKGKEKPDIILLFWFLYFSLHLIYPAFVFHNYPAFISYSGLDVGLIVFHVLFLDSYVSAISRTGRKRLYSLLLRGGILAGTVLFITPFLYMGAEGRYSVMTGQTMFPFPMIAGAVLLMGTAAFYLYGSYIKMKSFRSDLRQHVSAIEGLTMKWVDVLIFSFSLYFLFIVLFFLLMLFTPLEPYLADFAVYSFLVLILFWMGFSAIRQGSVFQPDGKFRERGQQRDALGKPEKKDIIFAESLKSFTEESKVYLDGELRMSGLAERLAVTPQYLSFVLNNVIGLSFYDFINAYRIEEVCRRIDAGDAERLTILALALDSGFNSKATFNRLFKKNIGQNPSEYGKKRLK